MRFLCNNIWKEGSLFVLFCSYEIHRTRMLQMLFLVSLESSWGGGVRQSAWFHDIWTCSAKVLKYWMIFSLKIKLNHSWKFQRNWNVPLVLLERSWWARFNGIYLVRFGFQNGGHINFQKFRVWKEKSVENVVTHWTLTIQFKHDFLSYLAVQKIDTYIAKQCSHVEFPYFVMGSHLGQWHRPH
jgi:hypothetical protein